jgi:hypothetical protein
MTGPEAWLVRRASARVQVPVPAARLIQARRSGALTGGSQ